MSVVSECPSEGIWPWSENGVLVEQKCEEDTVGPLLRRCETSGVWGEVDSHFCLPRYPPEGKVFVDFTYMIPYAKVYIVSRKPEGVVEALRSVYPMLANESIGVYRIVENPVDVRFWFV